MGHYSACSKGGRRAAQQHGILGGGAGRGAVCSARRNHDSAGNGSGDAERLVL